MTSGWLAWVVLAYVFVHQPADGLAEAEYAAALMAFHAALAAHPPPGLVRSWVWRVEAGPLGAALEEWYGVAEWAALGARGGGGRGA